MGKWGGKGGTSPSSAKKIRYSPWGKNYDPPGTKMDDPPSTPEKPPQFYLTTPEKTIVSKKIFRRLTPAYCFWGITLDLEISSKKAI